MQQTPTQGSQRTHLKRLQKQALEVKALQFCFFKKLRGELAEGIDGKLCHTCVGVQSYLRKVWAEHLDKAAEAQPQKNCDPETLLLREAPVIF